MSLLEGGFTPGGFTTLHCNEDLSIDHHLIFYIKQFSQNVRQLQEFQIFCCVPYAFEKASSLATGGVLELVRGKRFIGSVPGLHGY